MHTSSTGRRRRFRTAAAAAAGLLTTAIMVPTTGAATPTTADPAAVSAAASPGIEVIRTGLNSPKGLDSILGLPVMGQGAFGPPAPVVGVLPRWGGGTQLTDISTPVSMVDIAIAPDLAVWGIGADLQLYRKGPQSRSFTKVLDIPAYQATDPDPNNAEGEPTESNPYGLAILPNGHALIADAANNDVLRVTPRGNVVTVARFGTEQVATDHLPAEMGLPPTMTTEAVPTSIAVTPEGILVGELKGFPFRPGSSRIWRIDPNATGAVCSVDPPATPRGARPACAEYASGFTAIADLAVDVWTKKLYVYQLAADGVLAFEGGFETGEFPPAVLTEVRPNGQRRELAAGQLFQPGGVEVTIFGQVLATDGMFGDGRLVRVRT